MVRERYGEIYSLIVLSCVNLTSSSPLSNTQWGKLIPTSKNYFEITYPLSFTKFVIPLTMFKDGTDGDNIDNWGLTTESLNGCTIHVAQGKTDYIYYVAIGK